MARAENPFGQRGPLPPAAGEQMIQQIREEARRRQYEGTNRPLPSEKPKKSR